MQQKMCDTELYRPLTIGKLTVAGNLFLAPLAGYTDVAFRTLAIEGGADLTFTEMVSVEGLSRRGEKTIALLERSALEREYAVQLFLSSTDSLDAALDVLLPYEPTLIDINAGCPVPKVIKTGAGSAMMHHPALIPEVIAAIKAKTDTPVSVKFRIGWDMNSQNYLTFAQAALDGGADLLSLHARTRSQGYAPYANWKALTALKELLVQRGYAVPLLGSGDLFSAEDGVRMLRESGVDGLMFARGAIGNPRIFAETKALLAGSELVQLTRRELQTLILRHLDLMITSFGEEVATKGMRKHAVAYLKGIPYTSTIKQALMQARSRKEYQNALSSLVDL